MGRPQLPKETRSYDGYTVSRTIGLSWDKKQRHLLERIKCLLEARIQYLPQGRRRIYYMLWMEGTIEKNQEHRVGSVLKWARIQGFMNPTWISDDSRLSANYRGFDSPEAFMNRKMDILFDGYYRKKQRHQQRYLEIWVEKSGVYRVLQDLAHSYSVPIYHCSGFQSITHLMNASDRAWSRYVEGCPITPTKVLFFSDQDPSGWAMMPTMQFTLEVELECPFIEFEKVAVNIEHIDRFGLSPFVLSTSEAEDNGKREDPHLSQYLERFGDRAIELDALDEQILLDLCEEAIQRNLDMDIYRQQQEQEQADISQIEDIRSTLLDHYNTLITEN